MHQAQNIQLHWETPTGHRQSTYKIKEAKGQAPNTSVTPSHPLFDVKVGEQKATNNHGARTELPMATTGEKQKKREREWKEATQAPGTSGSRHATGPRSSCDAPPGTGGESTRREQPWTQSWTCTALLKAHNTHVTMQAQVQVDKEQARGDQLPSTAATPSPSTDHQDAEEHLAEASNTFCTRGSEEAAA